MCPAVERVTSNDFIRCANPAGSRELRSVRDEPILPSRIAGLRQLVEQRFRLTQVRSIESFAELSVDLFEKTTRLYRLALISMHTCHAECSAQLEGPRLLVLGDLDGLLKTAFRIVRRRRLALGHALSSSSRSDGSRSSLFKQKLSFQAV